MRSPWRSGVSRSLQVRELDLIRCWISRPSARGVRPRSCLGDARWWRPIRARHVRIGSRRSRCHPAGFCERCACIWQAARVTTGRGSGHHGRTEHRGSLTFTTLCFARPGAWPNGCLGWNGTRPPGWSRPAGSRALRVRVGVTDNQPSRPTAPAPASSVAASWRPLCRDEPRPRSPLRAARPGWDVALLGELIRSYGY